MLGKIIKLIIILTFPFNAVFAADIPIIVIAPSKKAQSVSTVGTSVTVLDETFFIILKYKKNKTFWNITSNIL